MTDNINQVYKKLATTIFTVFENTLSAAMSNTQNKKMKQLLLLEVCLIKMQKKHCIDNINKEKLTNLANRINIAICSDNWFCLKSTAYQAAIPLLLIATSQGINNFPPCIVNRTTESPHAALCRILDTLLNIAAYQQKLIDPNSSKYKKISAVIVKINNTYIDWNTNKNELQADHLHNLFSQVKMALGKHTRCFLTTFGAANALKVCKVELDRLESEIDHISSQFWMGVLY